MMTVAIPPSLPAVAKPVNFSVTQSTEKKNTPVSQADSFEKAQVSSTKERSGGSWKIPRYLFAEKLSAGVSLETGVFETILQNRYLACAENVITSAKSNLPDSFSRACAEHYKPAFIVKTNPSDEIIIHPHYQPLEPFTPEAEEAKGLFPFLLKHIDQTFIRTLGTINHIEADAIQVLED
jgi:hypothetical protein